MGWMHICFEWCQKVYLLEKILFYNVSLQLMIFCLWCQSFYSTWRNCIKGLKVLNKDQWCCQVAFCFVFQVCELSQFHRPWLMSNDILLQILKWWDFVQIFRNCEVKKYIYFLIDVRFFWWISELLFKNQYYLRAYISILLRSMSSFDM